MVLIGSLRGVKTATQLPTQFVPWKGRGRLGLMVYEATVQKKKILVSGGVGAKRDCTNTRHQAISGPKSVARETATWVRVWKLEQSL